MASIRYGRVTVPRPCIRPLLNRLQLGINHSWSQKTTSRGLGTAPSHHRTRLPFPLAVSRAWGLQRNQALRDLLLRRRIGSKPSFTAPESLSSRRLSQSFTLSDGRTLGFAEYGSPNGIPAFFLHGYVGSRADGVEWHDTAARLHVRIICMDRPGFGLSSFQPNRRILDLPGDLRQLARHLNLRAYYVFGQSGGGPYALACAYALPKGEVKGVGVVAGMAPWEFGSKGMKWQNRVIFNALATVPRLVRIFVETGSGCRGCNAREGTLFTKDWGFRLEDVKNHRVLLWWGTEDENAPIDMGRLMAQRLPNAELIEFKGDTHYTLIPKRYPEILARLIRGEERERRSPILARDKNLAFSWSDV
ncbi:hypothetical protein EPUS_03649 [Endocarpon pusillum Z07020]|uniref:AB hydrolase-1 domain-containing protein n=1 Tax=Endocarpon pusillum (strain Z07020 / HMAS-L-300199) TaxID=1263415 RepID=U1FXP5_ENDPU|nr:uncharacterized protein EPUS_03649 [Endocarpon pusillum Z07020]ERF69657.1 hypothetical protein EPUS_03649 [Endocarpon pusillum Z07020]